MIWLVSEPGSFIKTGRRTLIIGPLRMVFWPGQHRLETIIIAAPASITTAAIAWCVAEHVQVIIEHGAGSATARRCDPWIALTDGPVSRNSRRELAVRIAQHVVLASKRRRLEAAKEVVLWKLYAMRSTKNHIASVRRCREHHRLFTIELKASEEYWVCFLGRRMTFRDDVPDVWRVFKSRVAPRRAGRLGEKPPVWGARKARTPMVACMNYALGIVAVGCLRAVSGLGIDPSIGCALHSSRPGNLPIVWDCMEALRPRVYMATFRFVKGEPPTRRHSAEGERNAGEGRGRVFVARDFPVQPDGSLLIGNEVKAELARYVMKAVPWPVMVRQARAMERVILNAASS